MIPARFPSSTVSIAIVGVLFFIIGFLTWVNGPLITFVHLVFDLNEVDAFLVLMVFYLSYFFLALPSAWILKCIGLKKGLALSLLLMAVGAVVFGEFSTQRYYAGALAGLFVIGSGLALQQTAVNPYISILGPIESAARRVAVMGICNKVAGIVAPLVIGSLVLHGVGDLSMQVATADPATKEQLLAAFAAKIHTPYLIMAGLLAVLAVGVLFSPLPELQPADVNRVSSGDTTQKTNIFQFTHLWLGVLCMFVYVGVEVMAGDAIGTYGQCTRLAFGPDKTVHLSNIRSDVAWLHDRFGGDSKLDFSRTLFEFIGGVGRPVFYRCGTDAWVCIGGFCCCIGLCQCDDVASHFPIGNQCVGSFYRDRFSLVDYGDRWWRDHPAAFRLSETVP